jgi:hypothetical protein
MVLAAFDYVISGKEWLIFLAIGWQGSNLSYYNTKRPVGYLPQTGLPKSPFLPCSLATPCHLTRDTRPLTPDTYYLAQTAPTCYNHFSELATTTLITPT